MLMEALVSFLDPHNHSVAQKEGIPPIANTMESYNGHVLVPILDVWCLAHVQKMWQSNLSRKSDKISQNFYCSPQGQELRLCELLWVWQLVYEFTDMALELAIFMQVNLNVTPV